MKKDYYNILGVTKGASAAEIKKAYKKLAMQWHPDRHQGDKKAEDKFKEINEAYQVVGDKEKRQKYDTYGDADSPDMGGGKRPGGQSTGGFDFGDIFGGAGRSSSQNFEFDLGDLFGNFGNGGRKSARRQTVHEEESLDMEQVVELSIWDLLLGTKISIESPYSGKFKVTVPECTKPGTRLKVSGKGRTSGRKTGNLYLKMDARMPLKLTQKQRELLSSFIK